MLVLLGLWILHRYLAALAWAAVLAIALWPLYRRLVSALGGHGQRILAPLILTLSIGLIFIVPFVYAVVEVARETHILVQYLVDAQPQRDRGAGLDSAASGDRLSARGMVAHQFERPEGRRRAAGTHLHAGLRPNRLGKSAAKILHRLILFGFTLLTLFFLFRDGAAFSRQLIAAERSPAGRPRRADRTTHDPGGARNRERLGAGGAGRGCPAGDRLHPRRSAASGVDRGADRHTRGDPVRRAGRVRRCRFVPGGDAAARPPASPCSVSGSSSCLSPITSSGPF